MGPLFQQPTCPTASASPLCIFCSFPPLVRHPERSVVVVEELPLPPATTWDKAKTIADISESMLICGAGTSIAFVILGTLSLPFISSVEFVTLITHVCMNIYAGVITGFDFN